LKKEKKAKKRKEKEATKKQEKEEAQLKEEERKKKEKKKQDEEDKRVRVLMQNYVFGPNITYNCAANSHQGHGVAVSVFSYCWFSGRLHVRCHLTHPSIFFSTQHLKTLLHRKESCGGKERKRKTS
jgi:actin-related protein